MSSVNSVSKMKKKRRLAVALQLISHLIFFLSLKLTKIALQQQQPEKNRKMPNINLASKTVHRLSLPSFFFVPAACVLSSSSVASLFVSSASKKNKKQSEPHSRNHFQSTTNSSELSFVWFQISRSLILKAPRGRVETLHIISWTRKQFDMSHQRLKMAWERERENGQRNCISGQNCQLLSAAAMLSCYNS